MRTKQKDITNGESAGLYVAYADAFMWTRSGDSATLQERSLQLPRPGKVTRKKEAHASENGYFTFIRKITENIVLYTTCIKYIFTKRDSSWELWFHTSTV
jgi:hypothetical protein